MLPENELETAEEEVQENRSLRLILWLIVASLAVFFLPLYLIGTVIDEDSQQQQGTLISHQSTLQTTPTIAPEEQSLRNELAKVQLQLRGLEPIHLTRVAAHIDWPDVMATIAGYDPSQIRVTGITQTDQRLEIIGNAAQENSVIDYTGILEESDQFESVVVQSITLRAIPSPTPSIEATPAAYTHEEYVQFNLVLVIKGDN